MNVLPLLFPLFAPLSSQEATRPALPRVLPLRERAKVEDELLRRRLEVVVPRLMREQDVDLWVVTSREYAEDPVLETMLPSSWMSARRRTILVFYDPSARSGDSDAAVERFAVSRYDVGGLFRGVWTPEEQPDQWAALVQEIQARNPEKIAVNRSKVFALGGGIAHSEHQELIRALTPGLRERVVDGGTLAVRWLETRLPEELDLYPSVCRLAHAIIARGLSDEAIQPGVTTTADLGWWYRERAAELDLEVWFHPHVSVQRATGGDHEGDFSSRPEEEVIRRGDFVHIDFGIRYLTLCTDTQQHAYVLKRGEKEAPAGLVAGFAAGNELQDILRAQFAEGRSGNSILAGALAEARNRDLVPTIYSHPLGLHGHGAGPLIGLWDQQDGVPGRGNHAVHPDTAYAIELAVTVPVPEWDGQEVRFMLEEDAWFDGSRVRWIDGRQREIWLVR